MKYDCDNTMGSSLSVFVLPPYIPASEAKARMVCLVFLTLFIYLARRRELHIPEIRLGYLNGLSDSIQGEYHQKSIDTFHLL